MSGQPNRRGPPGNGGNRPTQPPPWRNSAQLGGEFVYAPSTDEIYMRNGQHFQRPRNVPTTALANATYNGGLPPPGSELPQFPIVNTGSPPTSNRQYLQMGLISAFNRVNVRPPPAVVGPRPVQVVFHRRTHSQAARGETPNADAPAIPISNDQVTSSLFKSYGYKKDGFFKVGRVFLVLWSEPAGGASLVSGWEQGTHLNHFGEHVFSKVRRFVVVRDGGQYSNCLPVNTYGGQGVSKRGVVKSEHAIIYTGTQVPPPKAEELRPANVPGMRRGSIQVDPDNQGERLDRMSRIDFGGVTKVQHNIKVKAFGMVNKRSLGALLEQYHNVHRGNPVAGPAGTHQNYALTGPAGPAEDEDQDEDDEDHDADEDSEDNDDENNANEDDDDDDDEDNAADDDDDDDDDEDQQQPTYSR